MAQTMQESESTNFDHYQWVWGERQNGVAVSEWEGKQYLTVVGYDKRHGGRGTIRIALSQEMREELVALLVAA